MKFWANFPRAELFLSSDRNTELTLYTQAQTAKELISQITIAMVAAESP